VLWVTLLMCERGGALYSANATFYSNNVTTYINMSPPKSTNTTKPILFSDTLCAGKLAYYSTSNLSIDIVGYGFDRRSVVGIFVVGFKLPDEVTSSLKNVWRCRSLIVGVKTTVH
jgi:hypothetical protein